MRAAGACAVKDPAQDENMVASLLALKARLDGVLRDAFAASEALSHAVKDALEGVINERPNRPAELIAKYIDASLRGVRLNISD